MQANNEAEDDPTARHQQAPEPLPILNVPGSHPGFHRLLSSIAVLRETALHVAAAREAQLRRMNELLVTLNTVNNTDEGELRELSGSAWAELLEELEEDEREWDAAVEVVTVSLEATREYLQ